MLQICGVEQVDAQYFPRLRRSVIAVRDDRRVHPFFATITVPEPAILILFGTGLLGLAQLHRWMR
jgi:hypothetical protein